MTLQQLTQRLKKDTNNSLLVASVVEHVFYGLITYSEALSICNKNLFYKK